MFEILNTFELVVICFTKSNLLTYLLNWPEQPGFRPESNTSFQAPLLLARLRQLVAPIVDRSSSIWSFQRIQGCPLRRLTQIPASNTDLAGASSSIGTTWPSQRSHWILIRCTMSMSLRSSYSSLLNRMWKLSPTRTVPKILRRTFLSNTLKAAASVLNSFHAFAP